MKRRNTDVVIWKDFFESMIEKIRSYELECNSCEVGDYIVTDTNNFTIFSTKTEKVYQFDDLEIIVGKDYRTTKIREIIKEIFELKYCGIKYLDEIRVMAEICHQYEVVKDS